MKTNNTKRGAVVLALLSLFILGMFCSCGNSDSTDQDTSKASSEVTATEAADQDAPVETTATRAPKTGTEDPAIDAVLAAAYDDIEGFDGKWQNIAVDVDETITTIDFDWNGSHYQYKYNQGSNEIEK